MVNIPPAHPESRRYTPASQEDTALYMRNETLHAAVRMLLSEGQVVTLLAREIDALKRENTRLREMQAPAPIVVSAPRG